MITMSRKKVVIDNKKKCTCCKQFKDLSDFYKSSRKVFYQSWCKVCISIKNKNRYQSKQNMFY